MLSRDFSQHTTKALLKDQSVQYFSNSTLTSKALNTSGLEKYYATKQKQQLESEIGLINNKINLLLKLEQDAQKKTQIAKEKAEKIRRAQSRNQQKLKEKEILKDLRQKEEQLQRKKNLEEKLKSSAAKQALQKNIYKEKQEFAKVVKKQRKEFDEISKNFKEHIRREKREIRSYRFEESSENKLRSRSFTSKVKRDLHQSYEDKIAKEKSAYFELLRQKAELEKQETELIEKYTQTLVVEKKTLKTLEAVAKVPLFQLGFRLV